MTAPVKKLSYTLFSIFCLFSICTENSSALPENRVNATGFILQDKVETVHIRMKKYCPATHFVLHDPERIVIDIPDAFIPGIKTSKQINGAIISGIRLHQNKKDVVRAVLDLNTGISYDYEIQYSDTAGAAGVNIWVKTNKTTAVSSKGRRSSSTVEPPPPAPASEVTLSLADNDFPADIFEDTATETSSDFSFSGAVHLRGTAQIKSDDSVENNSTLRNRVVLEGKYKKAVTLSALSDYLYFGSENKSDEYDISLHEAKWEHLEKKYSISLGKQIIRWGKTDQISPVDTLNPQDFREFILPDYEERKMPVWMANAKWFSKYFTLEGVVIPFFKASQLDYFDTNWSMFGHVKEELKAALSDPGLTSYINGLSVRETDPGHEAEFAIRLTTTINALDLSLTFHHMTEDTPYYKNFPIKNINVDGSLSGDGLDSLLPDAVPPDEEIEVEYKRTHAAGFEFETIWTNFGIRGEALWMKNQSFLTSSLTSSHHPTFTAVLGADHTTAKDTYINIQFLYSHIWNYSSDILYFDRDSLSLLGKLRMDLVSDWLQGVIKYNLSLNNNSHYISPYFRYTDITNLECILGASFFIGNEDTWFGRYKDYHHFYLNMIYHF